MVKTLSAAPGYYTNPLWRPPADTESKTKIFNPWAMLPNIADIAGNFLKINVFLDNLIFSSVMRNRSPKSQPIVTQGQCGSQYRDLLCSTLHTTAAHHTCINTPNIIKISHCAMQLQTENYIRNTANYILHYAYSTLQSIHYKLHTVQYSFSE